MSESKETPMYAYKQPYPRLKSLVEFLVAWFWLITTLLWGTLLFLCLSATVYSLVGSFFMAWVYLRSGEMAAPWWTPVALFLISTGIGLATWRMKPWHTRAKDILKTIFS